MKKQTLVTTTVFGIALTLLTACPVPSGLADSIHSALEAIGAALQIISTAHLRVLASNRSVTIHKDKHGRFEFKKEIEAVEAAFFVKILESNFLVDVPADYDSVMSAFELRGVTLYRRPGCVGRNKFIALPTRAPEIKECTSVECLSNSEPAWAEDGVVRIAAYPLFSHAIVEKFVEFTQTENSPDKFFGGIPFEWKDAHEVTISLKPRIEFNNEIAQIDADSLAYVPNIEANTCLNLKVKVKRNNE